jgi:GNAT superfamily N-acetyltransferase
MEADFYPAVFARYGIAVVSPNDADRTWVHQRYVEQLLRGDFRDETRRELVALVSRLRDEEGIDGVILGGTELPLLLTTPLIAGLPVLDTTALHVAAIVERLRGVPDALEIAPEALTSAVAAELIAALNVELSARYPEPGATHFRLDPNEVAPGNGSFLVARWLGRPVGCGALRRLREPALTSEVGLRVGELKRMYVAPEVRGRGIGRALLARLEAEARALGLDRLVLETGTRQEEALALYERAGFTGIPPYGEYAASSTTSVCLEKTL